MPALIRKMQKFRTAALAALLVPIASQSSAQAAPAPPKIGEAAATLAETEFVEKSCPGLAIDHAKLAVYFRSAGFTSDQLRQESKYQHVKDIDIPKIVAKHGAARVCYEIQVSWYVPLDQLRHKIVYKL